MVGKMGIVVWTRLFGGAVAIASPVPDLKYQNAPGRSLGTHLVEAIAGYIIRFSRQCSGQGRQESFREAFLRSIKGTVPDRTEIEVRIISLRILTDSDSHSNNK